MKYRYSIDKGVTRIKNNTKKYFVGIAASLGIASALAVPVMAAQPANQGCFGSDRATYAKANGSLGSDAGGVGFYAAQRAGDNGTINQNYKTGCGGDPATN